MEKTIYKKILEAQKKIGAIKKDKTNPFFKSKYADINAYIEEVKPILNDCGLIIIQPLSTDSGKNVLKTVIIDADNGDDIKSRMELPENPDPQKMGAIITYFRRYAIQSLLFLQAEDDDANSASNNTKAPAYKKTANRTVTSDDKEVPTCDICGELMKPTKAGSRAPFYCKHDDKWGKPVFNKAKTTPKEQEFLDGMEGTSEYGDIQVD